MWQRLRHWRHWLGQKTQPPSTNDETAPRIEPGLDAAHAPTDGPQPTPEPTPTARDDACALDFAVDAAGESTAAPAPTAAAPSTDLGTVGPANPAAATTSQAPLWPDLTQLDAPESPAPENPTADPASSTANLAPANLTATSRAASAAAQQPDTTAAQGIEPSWHNTASPALNTTSATGDESHLAATSPWADSRLEPVLEAHPLAAVPSATKDTHPPAGLAATETTATSTAPAPTAPITAPQITTPPVDDEPALVHVFATAREAIAPHFPCLSQQHLEAGDPEMNDHMQGLMHYVQGRNPSEMTPRRHGLWRHLQRVHHMWRLSVMPAQFDALGQWANTINAVVALPDGSIRDTKGYVLMASPSGRDDSLARLPHPPDAWQRKQATEARLLEHGWLTPHSLPPVAGEGEVNLRPATQAMGRALALLLVAVRAESLAEGAQALTPERLRQKLPSAFDHLTPQELQFVTTERPPQAHIVAMGWRYEALNTLLWALGLVDELAWPNALCDVTHCVSQLVDVDADILMHKAMLRPGSEILDQLDLHLRLHWLLRNAELQGHTPPDLRRDVVMERHQALNWLTGFEQADWDKVSTPT